MNTHSILRSWCLAAALGALSLASRPGLAQAPRERQLFDNWWRFHLGDVTQARAPTLVDTGWRELDLPHDWSIEDPYSTKNASGTAFLPRGIGWYQKTLRLPVAMRGRKLSIRFDGVYRDSTVWINGVRLGSRPYGYSTFEYDPTPHVVEIVGKKAGVVAARFRLKTIGQPERIELSLAGAGSGKITVRATVPGLTAGEAVVVVEA
ncbi:MAG: sugar-binding domain-containing protein [Bryobacteraceae bacterium]